jgi:two-component system, cell cycle sensor histidine kinase and response regulator CckA
MKESRHPARVLVIDDNPSIHEDIRKILVPESSVDPALAETKSLLFGDAPAGTAVADFEIDSAYQGEEGFEMVAAAEEAGRPYSLAFVDVRMPPGWDGIETITRIWRDHPELQIVICTAYSDYSWEDMVRQLGRSSSMVVLKKPFDNIEVLQLAHALTEKWTLSREVQDHIARLDARVASRTAELSAANERLKSEINERLLVERALVLSEERFSKAFNANPIPLAIVSLKDESISDTNLGFRELTGYTPEELAGHSPRQLELFVDFNKCHELVAQLASGGEVRHAPCQLRTKSGEVRDIVVSMETIELSGQAYVLSTFEDVTEQLLLEKQLRHSQKMEAVGQLAAGIAHDFNNMLTVIQGNASLILSDNPAPADKPLLEGVVRSAQRSAKLVRQLLAFSHKQMMEIRSVNIADSLASLADMLPRLLGEHIEFKIESAPDIPHVALDPSMLEQLLMNLAVNARDAMPRGGTLTLSARETEVTAAAVRTNQDAHAGRFLCLEVSDNGEGIAPEVLPRIFEPFFTTKPIGKGTGLGLATAYGIARQHDGWISVQTEVGKGSTFQVFIPMKEAAAHVPVATVTEAAGHRSTHGSETILVVEDEDAVRSCVCAILKAKGYNILTANNGVEALTVWREKRDQVDLLLTDMVMPEGMTGTELAAKLISDRPELPVIYTSGYSNELAVPQSSLPAGGRFLAKPYQSKLLVETIREALDGHAVPEPTGV